MAGSVPGPEPRRLSAEELAKVKDAARRQCSNAEIAAVIDWRKSTFGDLIKREPEVAEIIAEARELGKVRIRSKQFELMAQTKDLKVASQMAIHLGKQYCDQREQVGLSSKEGGPIELVTATVTSLAEKLAALAAEDEAATAAVEPGS